MAVHNKIGKLGERLAREYLEQKNYNIRESNFRAKFAEIDLVAEDSKTLVFVETRTKIGERFGTPEDTINSYKLKRLRRNAEALSLLWRWKGPARVDAVCVVLRADFSPARITHYKGII